MFYRFILFLGMFLFVYKQLIAQIPIQTDRPDQTECPFIVPKGFLQFETGMSIEKITSNNILYNHPSLLIKYGLSQQLELRIISELVSEKNLKGLSNGFVPITVGFKVNIWQEKGAIPLTSFIGHLTFGAIATPKFTSTYDAPSFRFTMQHTLSKKISLGYNIGAEWDGETSTPTYIYTFTSGFSLTEKLGSYIELYGFLPQKEKADQRADAGFTYLLCNDFMIDLSGGVGITNNAPKKYMALGFSFKVNTKRKGNKMEHR